MRCSHLRVEDLRAVIDAEDPRVVSGALQLAESRLDDRALFDAVISTAARKVPSLDMQLVLSLGAATDPRATQTILTLVSRYPEATELHDAAFTSLTTAHLKTALASLPAHPGLTSRFREQLLSLAVSSDQPSIVAAAIHSVAAEREPSEWHYNTLATLIDVCRKRSPDLNALPSEIRDRLHLVVRHAAKLAIDPARELSLRSAALRLLTDDLGDRSENQRALQQLLAPGETPTLRAAAARQLLHRFPAEAVPQLAAKWPQFTPAVREQLLDDLAQRTDLVHDFLSIIRDADVSIYVGARRRQQFMGSSNAQLAKLATEMFARTTSDSILDVVARYGEHAGTGDVGEGRRTFERVCATCHRLGNIGHAVGPELVALRHKSRAFLLNAILNPNGAVEDTYLDFQVETNDGRQFSGLLQTETANGLTLVGPDAKQLTILRSDIASLRATGKSLMPEGIDRDVTPQQMNSLLEFLQRYQPPRRQFAGNQPQVAPRRDDGSVRLLAIHAEIYGPNLRLEDRHSNLGYWASAADYAVWTVDIPEPTTFRVHLQYACDDNCAGNRVILSAHDQDLRLDVRGTGTWNNYHTSGMGELTLPRGQSRIVVRPDGQVRSYLLDLHQILLYPQ